MQDTRTEPVKVYESPLVAEAGAFAVTTLGSLDPNRPEGGISYRDEDDD
ncbi:hypothetical protein [Streptosporangium sp. NPDC049376]